jgi:hypothetical protein
LHRPAGNKGNHKFSVAYVLVSCSTGYLYLVFEPRVYMRRICLTILTCISLLAAQAQRKQPASVQLLTQLEEGMRNYANDIVNATEMVDRFRADSFFTRSLVKALQVPYSFSYPFDSLRTISSVYAPDSSFRIFTWQVMKDFTYYPQERRDPDSYA